jgi:mRNA interferase HigB
MLVLRTNVVENYFATHIGAKGLKAARRHYDAWRAIAEAAQWTAPPEIQRSHPKASILKGSRVVFNIKGNDFRLVVKINYAAAVVEIRFFGTHDEYDAIDAETV